VTGIYVRIKRGGKLVNVDIATLTNEELDAFIEKGEPKAGWRMVRALVIFIREYMAQEGVAT
jgi:hypothetical protein